MTKDTPITPRGAGNEVQFLITPQPQPSFVLSLSYQVRNMGLKVIK